MYEDVKSIIADYIKDYNITDVKGDYPLIDELDNGELTNILAYDLAKYDGFTNTLDDFWDGWDETEKGINMISCYNNLAFVFLLKYGLDTGLLDRSFTKNKEWLVNRYNNGNMFNSPYIKEYIKYRGQF